MNQKQGGVQRDIQQRDQKQSPRGGWITVLVDMAKALKLTDVPESAARIHGIVIKGDERAAEKMARVLGKAYSEQILRPNHFLSAERDLSGEIFLGEEHGKPVGVDLRELNYHALIVGATGQGKTTLVDLILPQASAKGLCVWFFDRKGDMSHRARDGVWCIDWQDFAFNLLEPMSQRVPLEWHRNEFVPIFCELMQFMARGRALFLKGVDRVYRKFNGARWGNWAWGSDAFPTIADLVEMFKRDPEFRQEVKGQGKESKFSIEDKLDSICTEMGDSVRCDRGFDLVRIYKERRFVSVNLDGLSVEFQNLFINTMMMKFCHYFKAEGPRNQFTTDGVLFGFGESKGFLGRSQENFVTKDLFSKIREFNCAVVCEDQIPQDLGSCVTANVGTIAMFRLADGADVNRMMASMGMERQQALHNFAMPPGTFLLRSIRFKDIHEVTVPPPKLVNKFISREELSTLMRPVLTELNAHVIRRSGNEAAVQQKPNRSSGEVNLTEDERLFIEALARNFERPASEVYKELGLGESAGFRIKQRLLAKGLISQVDTSLGKSGKRATFLMPNSSRLQGFGIKVGAGKGGLLHKHFQSQIKAIAEAKGFKAVIEPCAGESPDLGLYRGQESVAVEICITSKPLTESQNVAKNLKLGFGNVMLTFVSRDVMAKTETIVRREFAAQVNNVRFCLVNQIDQVL